MSAVTYIIEHRDTLTGSLIGTYYSDQTTVQAALTEAHAELDVKAELEYLVTKPVAVA